MAYIRDKRILFVHIPKNAGKSVEVALGLAQDGDLAKLGRRNMANRISTYLQRKTGSSDSRDVLHGTLDVALCAQHLTYQEILLLDLIPRRDRDDVRTFAVCRNPWSRAYSTFKHFDTAHVSDPLAFERFCRTWYEEQPSSHNTLAHQRRQVDFVLDTRGRQAVDRILRFENLAGDFADLCADWALDAPPLPHIGKQGTQSSYREIYTDVAKSIVKELFAEDIEFFEYEF